MPQPPYVCDKDGCPAIAETAWGVATFREHGDPVFIAAYSVNASVVPTFPEGTLVEYFCGPAHRLVRMSELVAGKSKEKTK